MGSSPHTNRNYIFCIPTWACFLLVGNRTRRMKSEREECGNEWDRAHSHYARGLGVWDRCVGLVLAVVAALLNPAVQTRLPGWPWSSAGVFLLPARWWGSRWPVDGRKFIMITGVFRVWVLVRAGKVKKNNQHHAVLGWPSTMVNILIV